MEGLQVMLILSFSWWAVPSNAQCNLTEGSISVAELLAHSPYILEGCFSSYFQIDLYPENSDLLGNELDYVLNIAEKVNANEPDLLLATFENETLTSTISLASHYQNVTLSLSAFNDTFVMPMNISFQEIPNTVTFQDHVLDVNDTLTVNDIQPNSRINHRFEGNGYLQLFDMNWDLQSNGYVAIQNGNGRVSLITTPSGTREKIGIGTKSRVTQWSVITQNRPSDSPDGTVHLEYSLGPEYPITTTMEPNSTTTRPPTGDIEIFFLAVNEQQFFDAHIDNILAELRAMVEERNCNLIHTPVTSCRQKCSMTDDPDRGCVMFGVIIEDNNNCNYTMSLFYSDLKQKIEDWKSQSVADRIALDDCLTPVQVQWITTAVLAPIGAVLVVLVGFFTFKRLTKPKKSNNEFDSIARHTSIGSRRIHNPHHRTFSQFEIVEDSDEEI